MRLRRCFVAGVAAAASAAALVVAAGPAAAAGPSATLTVQHSRINSGTAPVFTWSSSGLPRGRTLYLQRQFGTQHVWKNILTLAGGKGTVTAPKLTSLGAYDFRVHVVKNGATVVNSKTRVVYAYGTVSLAKLCAVYNGYTCSKGPDNGTVEVGSAVFSYQVEFAVYYYPSWDHALNFARTSCRSLSVRYASNGYGQSSGDTSYVRVLQGSADPVSSQVNTGNIGSLTAHLDGGAFYLDTSAANDHYIDMTGSASCWSANGKR
jgi:hypothetical protein